MSSATEYQPVPTETKTKRYCCAGCEDIAKCLLVLVIVAGFIGPIIFFRVLRIHYVNGFKPGSCRINSIETHFKFGRGINPIWNVDIVKHQPKNNLVVLQSNVQIWGPKDYTTASSALEDAQKLYSVSFNNR